MVEQFLDKVARGLEVGELTCVPGMFDRGGVEFIALYKTARGYHTRSTTISWELLDAIKERLGEGLLESERFSIGGVNVDPCADLNGNGAQDD